MMKQQPSPRPPSLQAQRSNLFDNVLTELKKRGLQNYVCLEESRTISRGSGRRNPIHQSSQIIASGPITYFSQFKEIEKLFTVERCQCWYQKLINFNILLRLGDRFTKLPCLTHPLWRTDLEHRPGEVLVLFFSYFSAEHIEEFRQLEDMLKSQAMILRDKVRVLAIDQPAQRGNGSGGDYQPFRTIQFASSVYPIQEIIKDMIPHNCYVVIVNQSGLISMKQYVHYREIDYIYNKIIQTLETPNHWVQKQRAQFTEFCEQQNTNLFTMLQDTIKNVDNIEPQFDGTFSLTLKRERKSFYGESRLVLKPLVIDVFEFKENKAWECLSFLQNLTRNLPPNSVEIRSNMNPIMCFEMNYNSVSSILHRHGINKKPKIIDTLSCNIISDKSWLLQQRRVFPGLNYKKDVWAEQGSKIMRAIDNLNRIPNLIWPVPWDVIHTEFMGIDDLYNQKTLRMTDILPKKGVYQLIWICKNIPGKEIVLQIAEIASKNRGFIEAHIIAPKNQALRALLIESDAFLYQFRDRNQDIQAYTTCFQLSYDQGFMILIDQERFIRRVVSIQNSLKLLKRYFQQNNPHKQFEQNLPQHPLILRLQQTAKGWAIKPEIKIYYQIQLDKTTLRKYVRNAHYAMKAIQEHRQFIGPVLQLFRSKGIYQLQI